MIRGISLSEIEDYISRYDKEEPKTIWKLGVLTSDVMALVSKKAVNAESQMDAMVEVVRHGLKGVENSDLKFEMATKNMGGYNCQVVADSTLRLIPFQIITELGGVILKNSQLSEEETKN